MSERNLPRLRARWWPRIVVLTGLSLLGSISTDGADMPDIFPYPTHVEVLDNGLKVVLVPMPSEGLVAYWTVVRTGSRDEFEPGYSGFAHFFEHMMFRGTEKYPADVFSDTVTRIGANTNAFTSDDMTAYYLGIAADDLETVMDLESDRFRNLSYSPEVFQTEAGAVYGEYRKNKTNPFFTLFEAVQNKAFDAHTYGHTTMGYERDIQRMPEMFDYSLSFFSRYYRPENTALLITGDIDVESTLALARKYYDPWKPGYVAPKIPVEPEQTAERRVEIGFDGQTLPILWIAYKVDRFDPTDRVLLGARLMAELAYGETSTLYKKLVLDEQIVEFIRADLGTNRDPGLLDIYTRVKDPSRVDYVLSEFDRAAARFRDGPPDEARLADLKSRLKYSFLMNLDTPDRAARAMARTLAVTGGVEAVERMYRTYDALTPEDVQASARKYLVPARRTVAVLRGDP